MRIEVRVIPDDDRRDVPPGDRQAAQVETHLRRGDAFTIQKSDSAFEGADAQVFNVPVGGRLVITTPTTNEELVYDREQGAAIRKSQQTNKEGRADTPTTSADGPQPPQGTERRPVAAAQTPPPPQGTRTPTASTSTLGVAHSPANNAASNPDAAAKAAQQATPRPPGESPPRPGSPAGSPPDGNEGKK